MLDPNKHGVYNMKTISGNKKRWLSSLKILFKGVALLVAFILSSIHMSGTGEFSDIAFCIWCLTLVQMSEL